ncbi:MAG: efflux RND transporter periplasmic adaptor subunit [Lentisphaerae bacterium]|nr:efflux RND transporter periplasmic adaptor subunit [Lentisphaerota bacterium]
MQEKRFYRPGLFVTGLLASAFILCGCSKKEKKSSAEREVRVQVQKIEKRKFRRQIPVQGTVDPVQFAVLSAKLGGTVEYFPGRSGTKLKKGDTLYEIDRQILANQVTVRRDDIKVREAEISIAKAKLDSALAGKKSAEANRKSAMANKESALRSLDKAKITKEKALISKRQAEIARDKAELDLKKAKLDYDRAVKLRDSKAISTADFEVYATGYRKAQTDVHNTVSEIAGANAEIAGSDAEIANAGASVAKADAAISSANAEIASADAEIKSAKANIDNAEAQLKQAQSNLNIALKNLADSKQTAPFDCTVVETYVEEKEYVSNGTKILKIENLDLLEVVCYISAVYYNEIVENKTKVEISADGKKYADAVVTYKAPSIDPQSRTFKVKAIVPGKSGLVSGMLCNINIILEEKEAYGLPADAVLLRANNRYIIYAAGKDKRAKSFDVKPGIVDGTYREILNPEKFLEEDIIVSGQSFVNAGALLRVTPVKK